MLGKKYRLKKRNAFSATYRTGITTHVGGITVFCGKNKTIEIPTRIGFVVSKKIHKRAVKRNRIKRLMRESVRIYIKENENFNTKHISLIFVSSAKLLDQSFTEIKKNIYKIMDKLTND